MQGTTTHNISEHLPLTLVDNLEFMCTLVLFIAILTFLYVSWSYIIKFYVTKAGINAGFNWKLYFIEINM